jgi:hypothetical protein
MNQKETQNKKKATLDYEKESSSSDSSDDSDYK